MTSTCFLIIFDGDITGGLKKPQNLSTTERDWDFMNLIEYLKNKPDLDSLRKEELSDLLEKCKHEMEIQEAININNKKKINAGYGVQAEKNFRFAIHANAESITSCGQLCVRGCANFLAKKTKDTNHEIVSIYEDTDSLFLAYQTRNEEMKGLNGTEEQVNKVIELNKTHTQPLIDEYFGGLSDVLNCMENMIEMDFEVIADKSTHFAPKKYVMRKIWEKGVIIDPSKNKFKFRGIEVVRTTTPQYFRDKLVEAIKIIFNHTNDDLLDFISETKKEYFKLPFSDMAKPTGVNGIDKYKLGDKHIPYHVFGSLVYNQFITENGLDDRYELIADKSKIKVSYVKTPNRLNTHLISIPDEYPEDLSFLELDYGKMFDVIFVSPIKRFLDVVGWSYTKVYSLEDCF